MIETLTGQVAVLQGEVTSLRAEVEDLRAKLRRDSSNSSQPPSSDPPWKKPEERRGQGKRKRGGQPGHSGHKREMVTPDVVVDARPEVCLHCGDALSGDDPRPLRHQVTEIPRVTAQVTEYRLHSLCCGRCGEPTSAPWPQDVPRGAFGPRLQAMVAVCSGAYRLSKRHIAELVSDFFGVDMSLGSVSNLEAATSEALVEPYQQLLEHVQKAQIVHADETTWAEASKLAWLWTAVTRTAAVFMIRTSRSAAVAQELIGKHFAGFLVSDRYQGYHWLSGRRRQLCWAHLIRNFRALLEWPVAKAFGDRLLGFSERLFAEWHRTRDGTCLRAEFNTALVPLQQEFSELLREGTTLPHSRVRAMCRMLLKHEPSLWTFTSRSGIEPTNNRAERALRHAVLWRKASFGTNSERGSRFVERMLTGVMTLRLQRRNVLDYVADVCLAAQRGGQAPSLLPGA